MIHTTPQLPSRKDEGAQSYKLDATIYELTGDLEIRETTLRDHLIDHWAVIKMTSLTDDLAHRCAKRRFDNAELKEIYDVRSEQMEKGLRHAAPLVFSTRKKANAFKKKCRNGTLPVRERICQYKYSEQGTPVFDGLSMEM